MTVTQSLPTPKHGSILTCLTGATVDHSSRGFFFFTYLHFSHFSTKIRKLCSSFFKQKSTGQTNLTPPGLTAPHVGSSSPHQGLNPCPLHWELEALTAGLPGKSQDKLI